MCEIGSESIQKRLLEEEDLELDKAMTLALGMEAAQRNAEEVKGTEGKGAEIVAVQRLKLHSSGSKWGGNACWHCGRKNHQPDGCRFKEATCFKCRKRGHIAMACKNEAAADFNERLCWVANW